MAPCAGAALRRSPSWTSRSPAGAAAGGGGPPAPEKYPSAPIAPWGRLASRPDAVRGMLRWRMKKKMARPMMTIAAAPPTAMPTIAPVERPLSELELGGAGWL